MGPGQAPSLLQAKRSGRAVIGMDKDQSMVDLAARRHPTISFARAALPTLPCAGRILDAVTANFVLNHTPDPGAAARELRRVLRPGGRLVATIWTSQLVPLNQMWNDVMRHASVSPPPGLRLAAELDFDRTVEGFALLLTEAGFGQVECHEVRWTFQIEADDLWGAVEAGIAVIGQTYQAQDLSGRRRMRATYEEVAAALSIDGTLVLPSVALIAAARPAP
ncbi:class I SAM-dependent methyltransferase [Friedmanniella luteola]|uniref:class I SAM-dependent methyltransferase n=1 Tax=Friedmanniella luteola TaxID=546871 RepID=UPI0012FE44A7|nr:class I SAM-dependent methyltransferase [Friedmanniella luteola]